MSRLAIAVGALVLAVAAHTDARQRGNMRPERVPDAGVVNGVPQGMFVGRSLLSGRAVYPLFLSGSRVTRFIPEGSIDGYRGSMGVRTRNGDRRWLGNQCRQRARHPA